MTNWSVRLTWNVIHENIMFHMDFFFGLNLRLVWPAPATPLFLGLWPRGLLHRTTIGPVLNTWPLSAAPSNDWGPRYNWKEDAWKSGSGASEKTSLKHFGMKASQPKTVHHFKSKNATPSCILRSEVHGTTELWMAHTTPGCIGSPINVAETWKPVKETVFFRFGFEPFKEFLGEIDAITPCLLVLGPRCSPRWRTQVAIILLAILNDDVMVMGILYPGRLEVCCAENCLSYIDRRLKKMNVFNTWTWTLQNDNNDSALNFMPKRLKDLGFPAKSDSTKCWHVVGTFDLKFPFN